MDDPNAALPSDPTVDESYTKRLAPRAPPHALVGIRRHRRPLLPSGARPRHPAAHPRACFRPPGQRRGPGEPGPSLVA